MNPEKWDGKASYAATSSSSPENEVGHSSGGSGFGNTPKVDQLFLEEPPMVMVRNTLLDKDDDYQRHFWIYSYSVQGEKNAKARQEYYGKAAEKLREILEENRIVRQRTKMQHEQNKEEVHGELVEILDEELRETVCDREIVWPPMVMVRNALLDEDDNEKWIGMRNQKLPDHFSGYDAVLIRYARRGISVLIFENSAIGYVEAERLHQHFAYQGAGRDAWGRRKVPFLLDGTCHQFYGYMANKEDLNIFNQHCQGEMNLKFEMRSHHEMVVIPMDGDDHFLFWLHSRAVKGEKDAKACQEYYGKAAKKLREALEENRIVRQKTKMQHEQNKEEMDFPERYCKDQNHQTSEAEIAFEELLQKELKKRSSSQSWIPVPMRS